MKLFSIGHSNLSYRKFAALLRKWEIEQVIDIRSIPYSKYVPHFNYEVLKRKLTNSHFQYEYLGNQLGSHNVRMRKWSESLTDHRRQIACDAFNEGIERVLRCVSSRRVAIMCAESDPSACHRHTILATELVKRGVTMQHILKNGQVRSAFDVPIETPRQTESWIQHGLFDGLVRDPMAANSSRSDSLPRVA